MSSPLVYRSDSEDDEQFFRPSSVRPTSSNPARPIPKDERHAFMTWIKNLEDPLLSLQEVKNKYDELVPMPVKKERGWERWRYREVQDCWGERLMEGPPKKEGILRLPGYGLPISHGIRRRDRQPFLLGLQPEDWEASTLTNREVCMLKLMEDITNKPQWWLKVLNPEIVSNWKREALQMPWEDYQKNADFTHDMAEMCFDELALKSQFYQATSLIPVMDYSACVIKSDKLLTPQLTARLKAAVAKLEDVPESSRDWHPGSDEKVLDLVHPSLWPLVYGSSKIVTDNYIPLSQCLDFCGKGVTIRKPTRPKLEMPSEWEYRAWDRERAEEAALSTKFQWLPCDVDIAGERPRIESYINNIHPVHHADLYPIIEELIEKSLPAWDLVCRSTSKEIKFQRFEMIEAVERKCLTPEICAEHHGYCYSSNVPREILERQGMIDMEDNAIRRDSRFDEIAESWYKETHPVKLPGLVANPSYPLDASSVKSQGFFNSASRIQVIVKLANIHLTPEKPTYDGGSWHVEGQLNEHICASALYYYDSENITDSRLAFRACADGENLSEDLQYDQSDYSGIEAIFAIDAQGIQAQRVGSVLTPEGRALFFPNVYQHQVEPFQLQDKTRPGHRKIVALFLVDPAIPIISTGNVPPQQKHWWTERMTNTEPLISLPNEIRNMILEKVTYPIGLEEAKRSRKALMKERSNSNDQRSRFLNAEWSFCEH